MKAKIMSELIPEGIKINGKEYSIARLPLRKIFRFVSVIEDFFGDIYDMIQGNLPPEVIAAVREVQEDEDATPEQKSARSNAIIANHLSTINVGVTAVLKKMLTKENKAYELVALCLNPALEGDTAKHSFPSPAQVEWVADNVTLADAVKIVVTVIKSELTEDFFGQIAEGQMVLRQAGIFGTDTSETDESRTSINGSGSSSPSLEPDGPATVTPIPS